MTDRPVTPVCVLEAEIAALEMERVRYQDRLDELDADIETLERQVQSQRCFLPQDELNTMRADYWRLHYEEMLKDYQPMKMIGLLAATEQE